MTLVVFLLFLCSSVPCRQPPGVAALEKSKAAVNVTAVSADKYSSGGKRISASMSISGCTPYRPTAQVRVSRV